MQRCLSTRVASRLNPGLQHAASPVVAASASPAVLFAGAGPSAQARGVKTDKMVAGAIGATMSSAVVIGTFHLIVVKVPLLIAAGTIGGSAISGVCAAFEGGEGSGGGAFGSIIGVFLGGLGAYYAKTSTEPWRK